MNGYKSNTDWYSESKYPTGYSDEYKPVPVDLAPHSTEAEEKLLGAILNDPTNLLVVNGIVTADSFYIARNGWVFTAMLDTHAAKRAVDTVTISEHLNDKGILAECGGISYLTGLQKSAWSLSNAASYAAIVQDMYTRRQVIEQASHAAALAHRGDLPIEQVLTESVSGFTRLGAKHTPGGLKPIGTMAWQELDRITEILRNERTEGRVRTHLIDLDAYLYGLSGGDLITLAAPPGAGKTSLLWYIAQQNAAHGVPVAFFSLEMTAEQLNRRNANSVLGVEYKRLERGQIGTTPRRQIDTITGEVSEKSELDEYVEYCQVVENWTLLIDEKPAITPAYLRSAIQKGIWEYGIELVIVDYFQKMKPDFQMPEREGLDYIANELKNIAKEFGVPVVCAAALNRQHDQRQDKRPVLSDLKGTSAIEYESDIVLFIYHDKEIDDGITELNIAKHRNGATGTIKVLFDKQHMTYKDLAR